MRAIWAIAVACVIAPWAGAAAGTAPWVQLTSPPGGAVSSIVFDTQHPGVAIVGSDGGRIFRSTDGGATWTSIKIGTPSDEFRAVAVSPAGSGIVYAYSSGADYSTYTGTLYRSQDDGLTWSALPNQPGPSSAAGYQGFGRGIVIDPTGQIIVLSDRLVGILRSADGGVTWTNPLPRTVGRTYGLAADPNHPGTLWAAGNTEPTYLGAVWKSTDEGASWVGQTPSVFQGGPNFPDAYGIAIQPGTGTIFATWNAADANYNEVGGIARSKDGGVTWSALTNGILPGFYPGNAAAGIAFDPTTPTTVYLSTNGAVGAGGFYKSVDNGNDWAALGGRLSAGTAFSVGARPAEPGYSAAIFAGSPGLSVSLDQAAQWALTEVGMNNSFLSVIVDDGAAVGGYFGAGYGPLFHTANSGMSWTTVSTWPGVQYTVSIAVDKLTSTHPVFAVTTDHVWRSQDGGSTWQSVAPSIPAGLFLSRVFVDPQVAGTVYLTDSGQTIYRSHNDGTTWTPVAIGNSGDRFASSPSVVAGSRPVGTLYAGLTSGLWKSTDSGRTWGLTPAQPDPTNLAFESMAVMHASPFSLFVNTSSSAPLSSADGGASFQPVTALAGVMSPYSGGTPGYWTSAPASAGVFNYDTTSDIWQSLDAGATFKNIGTPLTARDSALGAAVMPTATKVFVSDYDGTLWSANNSGLK